VSVKAGALLDPDSPAGLILYAHVRAGEEVCDFVSDQSWTVLRYPNPPATTNFGPAPGKPAEVGPAVELGGIDLAPWRIGRALLDVAAAAKDTLPVTRDSLVTADPLTIALGRPNREQFMTVRQTTATTLQALELTNGATLAKLLNRAATKLCDDANSAANPSALIDTLYERTLSRRPTADERALAANLLGSPVAAAGVEDLLWSLTMLPEFQLIY
jgi:hypothetical protein